MSIFDELIDEENKMPKLDMEYIYRMDMVWKPDELKTYDIEFGTVVDNVKQLDNNGYEFTIKGTTEILRTNYGWALAEHTEENLNNIDFFDKEHIKFKEFENYIESLRGNIKTLK